MSRPPGSTTPKVDVCVVTYRRPDLLRDLLESLQHVEGVAFRVIVVDNDVRMSAREVVAEIANGARFEIVYDIEPMQGITAARNRALSRVEATHFCFVDDDERVQPDWLVRLLDACQWLDADVVFGPVVMEFPPGAPSWAVRHTVFRRIERATGEPLEYGSTANCLVRTAALGNPGQRFDLTYGKTGGGDTEFFYRLHRNGRRLVWCDEAVVAETVSAGRLTSSWIRRRSYRYGQSFYRGVVARYSFGAKVWWFCKQCVKLLLSSCCLALCWFPSRRLREEFLSMALVAGGQLGGCLGLELLEEYRTPGP